MKNFIYENLKNIYKYIYKILAKLFHYLYVHFSILIISR